MFLVSKNLTYLCPNLGRAGSSDDCITNKKKKSYLVHAVNKKKAIIKIDKLLSAREDQAEYRAIGKAYDQ